MSTSPYRFGPYSSQFKSTAHLHEELESRLWQRVETVADLERDRTSWVGGWENVAVIDAFMEEIVDELDRRKRLRHRPDSPAWPTSWATLTLDLRSIKERVSIADYLSRRGVRLSGNGDRATCRCPLPGHDDSTPSFTVYHPQRRWHCFGCGRGGDLFDLHTHLTGDPSFRHAIADIAAEFGLTTEAPNARP